MSRLISTSFDTLCIDCNTISHWTPADGWEKTLLGFVKETKEMTSRANLNKGLYWPGVCETRRKRSPGESGRCPPCLSTFSYDSHWRALTPLLLSGFIWKKRKRKRQPASQPASSRYVDGPCVFFGVNVYNCTHSRVRIPGDREQTSDDSLCGGGPVGGWKKKWHCCPCHSANRVAIPFECTRPTELPF